MLVSLCPLEKRARLLGRPQRANGLGLGHAWGRGVPSNVVVHQAEVHRAPKSDDVAASRVRDRTKAS